MSMSNAFKITHVIEQLTAVRDQHGDLDCVLALTGAGALVAIDGRNVNVTIEALGSRLPSPVVVFGMSRDGPGQELRNIPGEPYHATDAGDGWNHDRSQAPEGEDVAVWKRFGGRDVGRRVGDDWFVREGALEWPARPVQIAPVGVMSWKAL